MTAEITVDLSLEKANQYLLKYFETRDDIKVKSSEPNSVEVRSSGWRPPPWVYIEIGVFGEDDRTRLDFNFDFRIAYATITIAVVMGIAILWVAALMRPENAGYAIGAIIGVLVTIPISFALEIGKAKKKFLDDAREAFNLPNKTD